MTTTIFINDYSPCLTASEYCGIATPSLIDIVVTGYWFDSVNNYWSEFTRQDNSKINIDSLGNVQVVAAIPVTATYPINARIIITN